MATHPFAMKLEDAIEKAKRLRDALRAAKSVAEDEPAKKDKKKLSVIRLTGAIVDLGAFGVGGNPLQVTPGGATKIYDLEPTPALSRLLQRLSRAKADCAQSQNITVNSGRFVNTADGSKWIRGGSVVNSRAPCPEVGKIQELISKLHRSGGAYKVKRSF